MKRIGYIIFLAIFLISALNSRVEADDTSLAFVHYMLVGLFIVDVGASLSNSLALTRGEPSRPNGFFGMGAGIVSIALTVVGYFSTDNESLRNGFALIMGTAGTTSLVLGVLNVRGASGDQDSVSAQSTKEVFGSLGFENAYQRVIGIGLDFEF